MSSGAVLVGRRDRGAEPLDLVADPDEADVDGLGLVLERAGAPVDVPDEERRVVAGHLARLCIGPATAVRAEPHRVDRNAFEGLPLRDVHQGVPDGLAVHHVGDERRTRGEPVVVGVAVERGTAVADPLEVVPVRREVEPVEEDDVRLPVVVDSDADRLVDVLDLVAVGIAAIGGVVDGLVTAEHEGRQYEGQEHVAHGFLQKVRPDLVLCSSQLLGANTPRRLNPAVAGR